MITITPHQQCIIELKLNYLKIQATGLDKLKKSLDGDVLSVPVATSNNDVFTLFQVLNSNINLNDFMSFLNGNNVEVEI